MYKILKTINMKTIKKIFVLAALFLFFVPLTQVMSQPPPPPGGAGSGDSPVGGNAPIGGGTLILLGMAIAYGGRKLYKVVSEEIEE